MSGFSALQHRCIFHTREKSDSHSRVAQELADHFLKWRGDRVDARLCKLDSEEISLYSLRYGAGVDIFPAPYRDFSLVHFSFRRGIEVTADGATHRLPEGQALLSSPRWNIKLRYQDDCEQLILRVPHALTRRVAGRLRRAGLHDRLVHSPGAMLSDAASGVWCSQLQSLAAIDDACRQNAALTVWRRHLEESLAEFLLLQFDRAAPPAEAPRDGARMPARQRRERLMQFAAQNLDQPVSLSDLAAVAALSERQLNVFCHEEFGQPPLLWLRGLRLQAVRAALIEDPGQKLSDVALRFGFAHFGRFSGYYHQRFGELPRQTLRAARSG